MVNMTSDAERDTLSGAPELSVSGLTVRFGSLTALEGVNLALRAAEVVALAGENGAGKTTLIRAIAGDVTPASGSIRVRGQAVAPVLTAAAKLGVRVVWQDLALADNLDVAANVMLGNERRRHLFSEVALHKDAARLLTTARHPAAGHHAVRQAPVRRATADGGGRAGHGAQPPHPAARRADRLAHRAGGGARRAADHPAARPGHDDPAVRRTTPS